MKLLFATTNPGKLVELRRLVEGLPVEVLSPADLPVPLPEVVEDGATFEENAAKKAVAFARAAGLHALADDSGLCVDALRGAPGVHSARWSEGDEPGLRGRDRDEANNRKLAASLRGLGPEARAARYLAVLVLAEPGGRVVASATGECTGAIALAPRGGGGFGYDPWFLPAARPDQTMAELAPAEKDAVSHRGAALRRIRPAIARLAVDERARRG